ncbi:SpaA isopeptide-forming pilin-related protein [Bifidobacterium sp. ESL0704]|uniref:SpaA isopeptide-forming pilin-related protein n=1 Tax=Bifidobacterium sp. ESL0704 TaxID=2983219 RepID=UPI0023F982A5|nr:SpaA isopeptide-forming pilin-related protein [Bifidobacterium sp. ESL0704]WEV53005.1 SpaA isopeptide-forming pilin-related protein [Bifidobacterium sp. ESL0704]
MNKKKKLGALVGAVVSAATLLALAPFGVANADSATKGDNDGSTPLTLVDPGKNVGATIKVMAEAKNLSGHTFAAVRLGTYKAASVDSNGNLTGFMLDTDQAVLNGSKAALKSIKDFTHDSNYSLDNPVGELASNYLGYKATDNSKNDDETSYDPTANNNATSQWAGGVRDFVTSLTKQTDFITKFTSASADAHTANSGMRAPLSSTNTSFTFSVKQPGLYAIEDVTGGSTNGRTDSIPMLVGTAVFEDTGSGNSKAYANVANGGNKLGEVAMKADMPTILKERVDPSASLDANGGYIQYYIKTQVPLTTGFDHYVFNVKDDSTEPLTYVNDSDHKTVVYVSDTTPDPDTSEIIPSGTYKIYNGDVDGTAITGEPSKGYSHRVLFNFYDTFVGHYKHGQKLLISYWMKFDTKNGDRKNVKNKALLQYSNSVNKQPNSDGNGNDNNSGNNGSTGGSGSSDNGGDNNNGPGDGDGSSSEVGTQLYDFNLFNKLYGDKGVALTGSEFQLFKSADNSASKAADLGEPLHFAAGADGSGVYSRSTKPEDKVTNLTPSTTKGDEGKITIKDLDAGDYVVKQVKGATGVRNLFLPQFTVTVGADTAGAAYVKNSNDNWNLKLVTASDNAPNKTVTVNNVTAVSQLPLTGSAGIALVLLAIVVLAMVAVGTTVLERRHKAARRAK